jgi:uncharacterized protein YegP (UPF0339 family)
MSAHYNLDKSTNGQFHFNLKSGNGEIILSSEMYNAKDAAQKGIASVQANCELDERYEKKTSSNDKPYFNLKAANHQVIGSSQMYASTSSRDAGIAAVKANGTSKDIRDNT